MRSSLLILTFLVSTMACAQAASAYIAWCGSGSNLLTGSITTPAALSPHNTLKLVLTTTPSASPFVPTQGLPKGYIVVRVYPVGAAVPTSEACFINVGHSINYDPLSYINRTFVVGWNLGYTGIKP